MKKINTIMYNKVVFFFIFKHWDIHLDGLCIYHGNLCYFITDQTEWRVNKIKVDIYKLSKLEKIKYLCRKWLFEICVGRHYTYPYRAGERNFRYKKPVWFWKFMFDVYYSRWVRRRK